MTSIRIFFPIAGAALVLSGIGGALAQSASPSGFIDNFDDWSAYATKENGKPLCYMASLPKKSEGDYSQRGTAYVMIAHWPDDRKVGEVSVNAGYTYKDGSEAGVRIDSNQPFKLFTDQGTAWTRDAKADGALVAAMKAGGTMVVTGTSSRGTLTTDTYSLTGFTAAYEAISKACGVK